MSKHIHSLATVLSMGLICAAFCACETTTVATKPAANPSQVSEKSEPRQAPSTATAEDYLQLKKQWDTRAKRLQELSDQLRKGESANRQELISEFGELRIDLMHQTLPRMLQAGAKKVQADEKLDEDIAETLFEMIQVAVSSDQYEGALGCCEALIEKKTENYQVYDFAGIAAFCTDQFDKAEEYFKVAKARGVLSSGKRFSDLVGKYKLLWEREQKIRKAEAEADDLPRIQFKTTAGTMVIELYENEAPQAVSNFVSLVERKFYDGIVFHRVIENFMAQGGDPTGTGSGGPGYKIFCECEEPDARMHFYGTLSMAHAGKNTGGSQFFLTFLPTDHLNGKHTAFGRVVEGRDVLARIRRVDPRNGGDRDKIIEAKVLRKRDHQYVPRKV